MDSTGEVAAALSVAAVLFLVAAKAHGREVRLERVGLGYPFVRAGGRNPRAVEALWALDRRIYWPVAAAGGGLGLVSFLFTETGLFDVRRPWDLALEGLVRVVLLPMVAAFAVSGGASAVRKRRRGLFSEATRKGSLFWWTFVSVLCGLLLLVFALP